MDNFLIELAGKTIEINPVHEYIRDMCNGFIIDDFHGKPDIIVSVNQEDIDYERRVSEKADIKEGVSVRQFSDGYLETLAAYRQIAEKMPEFDTLLFHGSAIASDGEGVIFTGVSGTGKSTHAAIWRKVFDGVQMINDDKPLISVRNGKAYVYGTPWNGKHRLSENCCVPVKAICMLHQSTENEIKEIFWKDALIPLFTQIYRPDDAAMMKKTLEIINRIYDSDVRYFDVFCNMEDDAAIMVNNAVFPGFSSRKMTYEELLERDGYFIFRSVGVSMLPLIKSGRDLIKIRARDTDGSGKMMPLKKYDVALFKREDKYVLHRVMEVIDKTSCEDHRTARQNTGKESKVRSVEYNICGDNQYIPETVKDEQIFGVLECVIREGKEIDPCDSKYLAGLEMNLKKRRHSAFKKALPDRIMNKACRALLLKK